MLTVRNRLEVIEMEKETNKNYCSMEYSAKHNCNGCTRSGICDLYEMLIQYGALDNEAREMCSKLEKRNNLGDVE
jgi:hypothetical protein